MAEDQEAPAEAGEETQPFDIQTRIAEKIRENAGEGRLTDVATIESLFTDEDPDVRFDDMAQDPQYADLKWVTTAAGTPLFYSDRHLSPDQAAREGALESAMFRIAEHVRRDSRDRVALTAMETAHGLAPEELEGGLEAVLERMAQTPRYQDIQKIVLSNGAVYLFSTRHLDPRLAARQAEDAEFGDELNP